MDWSTLIQRLWDPISTPVLLALGALAAHLWQRYLKRLSTFRWTVWHNRLAIAGVDPNVGRVDVLLNNNPVNNLQFCNIEFENESSQDFTNVEIKFRYEDGTQFLGEGSLYGSAAALPYLLVACDHPGVRLAQRTQRPDFWGVVRAHAALIGLAVGAVATTIIASFVARAWLVATLAFLIGAFGTAIGALVILAKRWVIRTIS